MSVYRIITGVAPLAEYLGMIFLGSSLYHNNLSTATVGISVFATANFLKSVSYNAEINSLNERLEKTEQLYEKIKKEHEKEKVDNLVKNHFGKSSDYDEGMGGRGGGCGGCG